MIIYIFLEHYPNPYKPYIDTQLIYLKKKGHDLRIFAGGKYTSSLNDEIAKYGLDKVTNYYPNTIKDLPSYIFILLLKIFIGFKKKIKSIFLRLATSGNLKSKLLDSFRIALLPANSPDLCLIHNLSTVDKYTFLKTTYPESSVFLYYHGGEVPKQAKIDSSESLFSKVDHVFTNTNSSKYDAISRGCPEKKISISPVGFDIDKFPENKEKEFFPKELTRIISIGRLSEEKGHMFALQAIRKLVMQGNKNILYRIIGDGHLRREMEQYIDESDLQPYVQLLGERSAEGVIDVLLSSDVLLLPSIATKHCAETQACVVQEAMLLGVPAITSRIGGVPESIPDEMKILSINQKNVDDIVDMIEMTRRMPCTEYFELGRIGRKFVVSRYEIGLVTEEILALVNRGCD